MNNDHAQVTIGDYTIPLIGLPPTATEMECELCGNIFPIKDVELNETGNQFLCKKCGQK